MNSSASGGSGASAPAVSDRSEPLSSAKAERDRRRLARRVLGGSIILVLAIIALTTLMLWRLKDAQLQDGLGNVSALDLLVAAQTERAFENVGVVLDDVSADLQAQDIASADALRRSADNDATFRLLRAKMAGIPQLDSLAIATSQGDVINRTRSYPVAPPTNVASREYFARLRDHPEINAYISPPLPGADGRPLIYIGKRLNAPNGAFIGIVLGALHAEYFQGLYANYLRALPGDGKSMTLWRSDGTVLTRWPLEPETTADATPPDLTRPMPNSGLLSYWTKTPHDGTVAVAQHRLDDLPLTVEVRQSASAMLAPWSGEFLATGFGGGALLLLVGGAVWLLMRQLRTEALIIEERARANRETEAREDIERARMKAEAAMRDTQQSEARFRDIAEVGSDWIWETDAEHRFTLVAGARQPRVNLVGKTRWDQAGVDPQNDPLWREHIATLDARQPFRQFRFARGGVHLCVSGKPIFADDGTFVGYRGTVSDESELIEARERALRADTLLRNAIESIAEGFVIFDAEDRFVMCNESYRKMYGENAAGFVPGKTYEEIMRQAVATGRHPGAIGQEEEWLAERLRKHREAAEPEESRLADGRWVMRSERRMADGSIAGLRIDITALKQAQEALRESQVMLNRAQKLSGTGSVVRNFQTKATEWSDEMYRIFGVERGVFEVTTENFLAMIHPEDRARVEDLISRRGTQAEPPTEFRIIRPDGTMRRVYREADLAPNPDGTPGIRLTTYKDTTEQREADTRHRELEVLLRDAIESISAGFVIYDAEDRLVLCNQAYRNLYPEAAELMVPGTRFEDVLRSALKQGRYPDAKGREAEWLADALRSHREVSSPIERQWSDGRWMLISERRTSSGGLAGLRVDITALKGVQQSLHASEQRLDRTQKVAHIGTVERDLRSGAVVWSEETYRIFGVDPATYTPSADNLLGFIHPEDRPLILDVLRRNHRDEANTSVKFRIVRPDGEIRSTLAQAHVASDKAGNPLYISIAMMDITDKEQASQRQIDLESQLRHSEKLTALGTLAGGIAHDLNNTLVPIQALSKLAIEELPAGTQARGDLESIYQASLQARDLVRQILAFSRKQEILNEPTDIAARARESLQMLRASVPSTIEIIDRIAPIQSILADGTQLQQVIVNLVTNGAYAIGDNCGRVTVTLDEVPGEPGAPRFARLSVADTGCGMSPAIMHRMFEPFFTTKAVGEGTGLGLSVVHGIVTSHGGTIDVKSTPGEGTEFIILLPARPVDESGAIAAVA
ncbi:MAG TPA: PAS-domain containing protein [Stellaceae bacterium]